jgi:cytidylate kinase
MGNTLSCSNGGHHSKKSKSDFHSREYYRATTSEMSAKNSEKLKNDNDLRRKVSDNEIDKKASAIDELRKVRVTHFKTTWDAINYMPVSYVI